MPGDTNTREDVFVRDTRTSTTKRINVSSTGAQGTGYRSIPPSVSIDAAGRYVAFQTDDPNLMPGKPHFCTVTEPGTQPCADIYVRDLRSDSIRRVNVSNTGELANGVSEGPMISADGRYVAFVSFASNLVPGDTNNTGDVFVADLQTSTLTRVSVSSGGAQADASSYSTSISADGRYVAFDSPANSLATGKSSATSIGIFVRDLQTGTTRLVGEYGTPYQDFWGSLALSANGRYVVFDSLKAMLLTGEVKPTPGILEADTQTGSLRRVTSNDSTSGYGDSAVVDASGRYVAFSFKPATPLNGPAQIRVRDLVTGRIQIASVSDTGHQGDGNNFNPAISGDGRYVAFNSNATNLTESDLNFQDDLFLRGPLH